MDNHKKSIPGELITALGSVWLEFKAFALSGNMFDLALGFIIGTAFSKLVDSLAGDVIMQGIAAVVGKPDFRNLALGPVRYGSFLTQLLNFLLLASVLFALVKLMGKAGLGNFTGGGGTRGTRHCTHCKESVSVRALRCKWCGVDLDPVILDAADQEIIDARNNIMEAEKPNLFRQKVAGTRSEMVVPVPGTKSATTPECAPNPSCN